MPAPVCTYRPTGPLNQADEKELADFDRFLDRVNEGVPRKDAYAEIYGEVIFDASKAPTP